MAELANKLLGRESSSYRTSEARHVSLKRGTKTAETISTFNITDTNQASYIGLNPDEL
jgi:hypothetical protein